MSQSTLVFRVFTYFYLLFFLSINNFSNDFSRQCITSQSILILLFHPHCLSLFQTCMRINTLKIRGLKTNPVWLNKCNSGPILPSSNGLAWPDVSFIYLFFLLLLSYCIKTSYLSTGLVLHLLKLGQFWYSDFLVCNCLKKILLCQADFKSVIMTATIKLL